MVQGAAKMYPEKNCNYKISQCYSHASSLSYTNFLIYY